MTIGTVVLGAAVYLFGLGIAHEWFDIWMDNPRHAGRFRSETV